jgi:hypothetical protein
VLAQAKACGYIFHLAFPAAPAKCLTDTTGFLNQKRKTKKPSLIRRLNRVAIFLF